MVLRQQYAGLSTWTEFSWKSASVCKKILKPINCISFLLFPTSKYGSEQNSQQKKKKRNTIDWFEYLFVDTNTFPTKFCPS